MRKKVKITILFPCLNEDKTIKESIQDAKKQMKKTGMNDDYEILVVDNGSTDNSVKIAEKFGARVIKEKKKGYGNALKTGFKKAYGKYIVFADCDNSYRFENIKKIISLLDDGADFVIGNRYKGKMEKNAMPLSHKYIGTPIISFIGRVLYKLNIYDFNCGLRGIKKEKINKIELKSEGMEFASEMIIKAKKNNLKIVEIPINFYKDKRNRKSHLRTIRDGFRHLKILLGEYNK